MNRRAGSTVFAVLLIVATLGCGAESFRTETEFRRDGSIDRAIYQPRKRVEADIASHSGWSKTQVVAKRDRDDWIGFGIRDLPAVDDSTEDGYFAAWGTFKRAADIPSHYLKSIDDGRFKGSLQQDASRTDWILVTEFVWEETLTNIVERSDLVEARAELATWVIRIFEQTLDEALGPKVDSSRLISWLKDDGVAMFNELVDVYYDLGVRRLPDRHRVFEQKAKEIGQRRGVPLNDEKAIREFAFGLLKKKLRAADGTALDDAVLWELLASLGLGASPAGSPDMPPNRFETARTNVMQRRYGGPDKATQRLIGLMVRIVGLYEPFGRREEFDAALTMPGLIVETNGVLQGDAQVSWSFTAEDAYPRGVTMRARSLAKNDAGLPRALKTLDGLKTRRQLQDFVDAVSSDKSLLAAVRQCQTLQSLAPLEHHRVKVEQNDDKSARRAVARLWQALGLPR